MSSLYDINSALLDAIAKAEIEATENDGIIEDATAEILDTLEMEREEKITNTALYIKNLDAEAVSIKAEEKKLKDRRTIVENKSQLIKEWLKFNLHGESRTAGNYKISYRKSKAVSIENQDLLPVKFLNTKVVSTPDKTAIKKAILGGAVVKGAIVIEKQNMEVK